MRDRPTEKGPEPGERWPSGLRRHPAKVLGVYAPRGFESHPLRHRQGQGAESRLRPSPASFVPGRIRSSVMHPTDRSLRLRTDRHKAGRLRSPITRVARSAAHVQNIGLKVGGVDHPLVIERDIVSQQELETYLEWFVSVLSRVQREGEKFIVRCNKRNPSSLVKLSTTRMPSRCLCNRKPGRRR